jgi:hypothetical protein
MLEIIFKKSEIRKCQHQLESNLKSKLKNKKRCKIGSRGGNVNVTINHNNSMWFYTAKILKEENNPNKSVANPRYWNAFGYFATNNRPNLILEINPPIEGVNNTIAGIFAKDSETGELFFLHSGNIGGGTEGVGKNNFKDWLRWAWTSVTLPNNKSREAILIGNIDDINFTNKLDLYLQEVHNFKQQVRSGKVGRKPNLSKKNRRDQKSLLFNPEFSGKIRGKRKSKFNYDSNHGLVVNELVYFLQKMYDLSDDNIFNTKQIDLGIQKDGSIIELFEIKTKEDSQSIYTGIGQLLFHSGGNINIKKTLVLPSNEYNEDFIEILSNIGIRHLTYEIMNSEVSFPQQ